MANGLEVFIDSPLLIDLLDLSDKEHHGYIKLLIEDLKSMGVYLKTFAHNVEEVRSILEATLRDFRDVRSATGQVASRLRSDQIAATRAAMIKSNVAKHLQALGIQTNDMGKSTRDIAKYCTDEKITDLTARIRVYGDIRGREVDAKSVVGVSRKVLAQNAPTSVFSLKAFLLTKNAGLVGTATNFLRTDYNYRDESAIPFLTDRQLAGLLWLARGGDGGGMTSKQLLANCTRAIIPRRDVLARIFSFLSELDEGAASEFEVLMTEDRCAHYVMNYTLGDAALVTKDNAPAILEAVKRAAVADTIAKSMVEHQTILEEQEKAAAADISNLREEFTERLRESEERQRLQEEALQTSEKKIEEVLEAGERAAASRDEANSILESFQVSNILAAAEASRRHSIRVRVAIASIGSLLLALLGTSGSYIGGLFHDRMMPALWNGGVFVVTVAVTFLFTWSVPDMLFKNFLFRVLHKRYERELALRGALSYAELWHVDWKNPEKPPERTLGQPSPREYAN